MDDNAYIIRLCYKIQQNSYFFLIFFEVLAIFTLKTIKIKKINNRTTVDLGSIVL